MKSQAEKYLKALGLQPGAKPEAIRSAYRNLAKKYHPDAAGESQSPEKFRAVQEAYENLSECHVVPPNISVRIHHRKRQPSANDIHDIFRNVFLRPSSFFSSSFFASPFETEPDLEILLSPDEAANGATLWFQLPLQSACLDCAQTGIRGFSLCSACNGRGNVIETQTCTLELPGNIPDGSLLKLTLPGSSHVINAVIMIR
jgi:molecular chaperone DnaJ